MAPRSFTWTISIRGFNIAETGVADTRLFIAHGGNIGIGTSTPDRPLTVRGAGQFGQWISFQDPNGATQWHFNYLGGGFNVAESGASD